MFGEKKLSLMEQGGLDIKYTFLIPIEFFVLILKANITNCLRS